MKISYKALKTAAVFYSALPIFIFFIGWLSPLPAVIFSLALAASAVSFMLSHRDGDAEHEEMTVPAKKVIAIGMLALVWCVMAGQGHFFHQSLDYTVRNPIFKDLINKPWPVTYSDDLMLSYYIAHWLPAAAAGKLFTAAAGSAAGGIAAHIALLLYTSAGVYIVLLLVVLLTGNNKYSRPVTACFLFIFFSGLDSVGAILNRNAMPMHLEWWAAFFQYSSVTTCLFWVFNQTVVPWLMTLCIMNEKSPKNFAFFGLLALPFGPFPFVGIFAVCIIRAALMLRAEISAPDGKKAIGTVRSAFSLQNILAAVSVAPVYALYYMSNMVMENDGETNFGFRLHNILTGANTSGKIAKFIIVYLLFSVLEFGIYFIILERSGRSGAELRCMAAMLAVIPLFQVGSAYDFSMRVSIPPLMYICIGTISLFLEKIPKKSDLKSINELVQKHTLLFILIYVYVLGSVTPITEIVRETSQTVSDPPHFPDEQISYETLYNGVPLLNFMSENYKDSGFYRLLMKK